MYQDRNYKDHDPAVIKRFIEAHPFAMISGCDREYRPVATQAPVFLEQNNGKAVLRGHMIKGADHHKAFAENPEVMTLFSGPNAYVSATWYTDKQQASTWNYMSVQVRGRIAFLDEQALVDILRRTTLHFEHDNAGSPTIYDNLPESYTHRLLEYIVAFEIEVLDMDHVFKLSQEKDSQSFENIIAHLEQGDGNAREIAMEMENRKHKLFGDGR